MKILYSIQATGNGHISRAHQIIPYLEKFGKVDVFLSGSNKSLDCDFPVKFKSDGFSLFFSPCGKLDYYKTFRNFKLPNLIKQANELPVEKYDLVINDFEHITSRACKMKNVPSVHFGHQASFRSKNTPRPEKRSIVAEWILNNYANATKHIGLHFQQYDDFIFPPVIKEEFIRTTPQNHGHITIYLPAYKKHCIEKAIKEIAPQSVHWFLPEITHPKQIENVTYFPVNQKYFNESLIYCKGIITGGGFETPSEALYLGKKLMSIPIHGQYEQQCNATALKQMGVKVLNECNHNFAAEVKKWLYEEQSEVKIQSNNILKTIQFLIEDQETEMI